MHGRMVCIHVSRIVNKPPIVRAEKAQRLRKKHWKQIQPSLQTPGYPLAKPVSFKGSNGQYVCGENGTQAMRCNRATASDWEKFTIVDAGGGKIALRSMGKFVSSENGTKAITRSRTTIGGWEQFTQVENADGTISFLATTAATSLLKTEQQR